MRRTRVDGGSLLGCAFLGIYLLVILGVITFWCLIIYALYLLVTGQLHLG